MNRKNIIRLLVCMMILPGVLQAQQENKKLAQTGMKFLNVGMGARQAAMVEDRKSVV